jgi:hypothetical protein
MKREDITFYRFQSATTQESSRDIPFDLIYIFKDTPECVALFQETYEVFIKVVPSEALYTSLMDRKLQMYSQEGVARSQTKKTKLPSGNQSKKVGNYVPWKRDKVVLGVPVLTGKYKDIVVPRYTITKPQRYAISRAHKDYNQYSIRPLTNSVGYKSVVDMTLVFNGKEELPCNICNQSIHKLIDDNHCLLGSTKCLEKICLKGVATFTDKFHSGKELSKCQQQGTEKLVSQK